MNRSKVLYRTFLFAGTLLIGMFVDKDTGAGIATTRTIYFFEDVGVSKNSLFSDEDTYWLSRALYFEARGEVKKGIVAVGNVILNRVNHEKFPNTVKKVVTQGGEKRYKCQFSFYCDGLSDNPSDSESWKSIQDIVLNTLQGSHIDESDGSVYYFNPDKAQPCWGNSKQFVKKIGKHKFFRFIYWEELKSLCRA